MVFNLLAPFRESGVSLIRRLTGLWDDLCPQAPGRDLVLRQSMLPPACGTGLLADDQARRIYCLTAEVTDLDRSYRL